MKPSMKLVVSTLMALALSSALAIAQQRGPRPSEMMNMPRYDPSTEVTLSGTVEKVEKISETQCPWCEGGTHIWIEAEGARHEVHLGPSSFLDEKGWTFEEGDPIQVTGSKVELRDTAYIVARQVTMGEKVLTLRDERGIPLLRRGPGR